MKTHVVIEQPCFYLTLALDREKPHLDSARSGEKRVARLRAQLAEKSSRKTR